MQPAVMGDDPQRPIPGHVVETVPWTLKQDTPDRVVRVAVASGKGGTGKTTVATSLARSLADRGGRVAYLDCDVEAPDGHLFLPLSVVHRSEVSVSVAQIDSARCLGDGACARVCRFGAVLSLPGGSLVFPDLCHGCGGCVLACPQRAVQEIRRGVGSVEAGYSGDLAVRQGRMDVGRQAEHEMVRAVRAAAPEAEWVILDAPPGVGCPVVETIRGTDVVLLVTEPTPAGLHDLKLAVELVRELGIPCGVVLNRAGQRDPGVRAFCAGEDLPVLADIPETLEIARAYSRGHLVVEAVPALRPLFDRLATRLAALAGNGSQREPIRSAGGIAQDLGPQPRRDEAVPGSGSLDVGDACQASPIREVVVLSGKGGTGKTSIAACLAALAESPAMVDADVDAANLHLLLDPRTRERRPFAGGQLAVVDSQRCTGCGLCAEHCRFDALDLDDTPDGTLDGHAVGGLVAVVDPAACEGCGVCVDVCPEQAVDLVPRRSGEWFTSTTAFGPMAHARLVPGQQNSGKLVSLVRDRARALGQGEDRRLLVSDGPPGVGCPAIAALAGADQTLLVTEPTLSGLHDLRRIAALAQQFGVPAAVCINKVDLNPALVAELEMEAARQGLPVLGRVHYDEAVGSAHQAGTCVVVHAPQSPAARDIRVLWRHVQEWAGVSMPRRDG